MKHLSLEDQIKRNELIISDYKNGMSRQDICMKYGISCVGKILKDVGIEFKSKGGRRIKTKKQEDFDYIKKQCIVSYRYGASIRDLANRFDFPYYRINKILREAGGEKIKLRQPSNMESLSKYNLTGYIDPYYTVNPKRYNPRAI